MTLYYLVSCVGPTGKPYTYGPFTHDGAYLLAAHLLGCFVDEVRGELGEDLWKDRKSKKSVSVVTHVQIREYV